MDTLCTAGHISARSRMHRSEYSGLFGDYSSYSAEYDEINDPDLYPEDISEEVSETSEEEEADKDEN